MFRALIGCAIALGASLLGCPIQAGEAASPNIMRIDAEDLGPHLGCYGDPHAETPNIDSLAEKGVIYETAWSNNPICAPARTTLITGMYATSLGGQHMRSWVSAPPRLEPYARKLRNDGYYTVKSKTDYNVETPGKLWDSGGVPWDRLDREEPFFISVHNGVTHESGTAHGMRDGDFSEMTPPAFQPNIPEAREDWATYYRQIGKLDDWVGQQLQKLKEAGHADDTIVIFYGDHGPGLPRGKRFAYNYGLRVPLIVYIPPKYRDRLAPPDYKPGATSYRLVSFVDLGPTFLSLAGIEPPEIMQGRPFMGKFEAEPRDYLFGFRGRADERVEMTRTVRDQRFQLIRNYMPHRRHGQYVEYLHRNPTLDAWKRLYQQGKIGPPASFYWQKKPAVELYDLQNDPDQVRNLAYNRDYQEVRERLMERLREHQEEIRDTGFLPEAQIHNRPLPGESPYEFAQSTRYPLERIREMAEMGTRRNMEALPELTEGLTAADPAVRYWAATGFLVRGQDAVWPAREKLRSVMQTDDAATVRVVAAECLVRHSDHKDRHRALEALLKLGNPRGEETNQFAAIAALNTIDKIDETALPIHEELKALPKRPQDGPRRASGYTQRLLQKILSDLERIASSKE